MILNVWRFGLGEIALQQAKSGDVVYFPGQREPYVPLIAPNFQVTKSVEIRGDGAGDSGSTIGSVIQAKATLPSAAVSIEPPDAQAIAVRMRDFKVNGEAGPDSEIKCALGSDKHVTSLVIERVFVLGAGNQQTDVAFQVVNNDPATSSIVMLSLILSGAVSCKGLGFVIRDVVNAFLMHVLVNDNGNGGILCDASGAAMFMPVSDGNKDNSTPAVYGHATFLNCRVARVDAGHFENFGNHEPKLGCRFEGSGGAAVIGGSNFTNVSALLGTGRKGIVALSSSAANGGPITIQPNGLRNVHPDLIEIASGVDDVVLLPQFNRVDDGLQGEVRLPGGADNGGLMAMPCVRRVTLGSSGPNSPAGLIVPSGGSLPPQGQDGVLFYDALSSKLAVQVAGGWKEVALEP